MQVWGCSLVTLKRHGWCHLGEKKHQRTRVLKQQVIWFCDNINLAYKKSTAGGPYFAVILIQTECKAIIKYHNSKQPLFWHVCTRTNHPWLQLPWAQHWAKATLLTFSIYFGKVMWRLSGTCWEKPLPFSSLDRGSKWLAVMLDSTHTHNRTHLQNHPTMVWGSARSPSPHPRREGTH